MSNEMIERVTKAIRDSFNSNDIDCYPIAKAAIAAMREPTVNMIYELAKTEKGFDRKTYEAMIDAALDI
jgi:hypothetical protein